MTDIIENNGNEKKKKRLVIAIFLAAALIAALAGIGIYNAPINRLHRQLELADKCLEEERYEEACLAFEQAIAIDERCMEAYMGGIEAYQYLGDMEHLQALYDRALSAAEELDTEALAADREYLVEIYLMTQEIYGHDLEHAVECLTQGCRLTAEDERVKEQLIGFYLKWADELVEKEEFEKAISELTKGYEETQDERLNEKIKEVQEKYKQYQEWKAYLEFVDDILVRIAASCQKEDYQAVFTLMQSEEYARLLERVHEIKETIGLDTEYGKIGLYKVDSDYFGNYMIYYGEYAGDIRQGAGVWLGYYEGNNYLAIGNWADDKPQGEFSIREWSVILDEDVIYRVISGNVDDGLWNGDIVWGFEETDGSTHSYPVSFINGKWVILYYDEDGSAIVSQSGPDGAKLSAVRGKEDCILGIAGFAPDY